MGMITGRRRRWRRNRKRRVSASPTFAMGVRARAFSNRSLPRSLPSSCRTNARGLSRGMAAKSKSQGTYLQLNKFYMSHEAHATFGSINVRKCQIRKEGLHKSVALVPLTLDSFSSESLVWLPFLMSSLLMSTEFFARQKDFSCSFIVDRLGNRFPQNWQAKNFNSFFDENGKFLRIYFIINQSQNWSKRLTERFFSRVNSLVGHDVSSLDECFVAESKDPLYTVSKVRLMTPSEAWANTNLHLKGLSPRWILSWRRRFPRRLKVLPQREQAKGPLKEFIRRKNRVCRTLSLAFLPSETVRFWLTFIPGTGDRPTGEIIPDLWTFLSASSEKGFG